MYSAGEPLPGRGVVVKPDKENELGQGRTIPKIPQRYVFQKQGTSKTFEFCRIFSAAETVNQIELVFAYRRSNEVRLLPRKV